MGKIAFLFPGQGAQYVGMGKEFYDAYEESKEIFNKAEEILDFNIKQTCFEENEDINITEYTQASILTASEAIRVVLNKLGYHPEVCAGLSLGEYNALIASGVLSFEDAIYAIRQRGILMQNAVKPGQGNMAAVIKLDASRIKEICEEVDGIVSIANYNCADQTVISGETLAIAEASERLKQAGAKRVLPLNVSGPFHSPLLKKAGDQLYSVLDKVTIHTPFVPYISNVTAKYVEVQDGIRELLAKQVYSSVHWQQSMEEMNAKGVDTFIEIGPGKTLSGLAKKICPNANVYSVEKLSDLMQLMESLPV